MEETFDLNDYFEEIEKREKELEEKGYLKQKNFGPIKRQNRRPKTKKMPKTAYKSVLVNNIRIESLGRPSPPRKLGVSLRNTPEMNQRIVLEKIKKYDLTHLLKQLRALRAYWHRHNRQAAEDLIAWAEKEMLKEMERARLNNDRSSKAEETIEVINLETSK